MIPKYVVKTGGFHEKFKREKLMSSIEKAFRDIEEIDNQTLTSIVSRVIRKIPDDYTPTSDIKNYVILTLSEMGYSSVAEKYILYTEQKAKSRAEKLSILSPYYDEDVGEITHRRVLTPVEKRMSVNAVALMTRRYLWRKTISGQQVFLETVDGLFRRVAIAVSLPELLYDMAEINGTKVEEITLYETQKGTEAWEYINSRARLMSKIDTTREVKVYKWRDKEYSEYYLTRYHIERLWVLAHRFKVGELTGEKLFHEMLYLIFRKEAKKFFKWTNTFYEYLTERIFVPNTPALVNMGRKLSMGSACFTLSVEDSLESIMDTAKEIAIIAQAGGGIGVNFSYLRPAMPEVALSSTGGLSSGVVSWLKLYNAVLEQIKQGSVRRGAGMGILEYWHPEIFDFIEAKKENTGTDVISNFNLSVGTDEKFWEQVYNDGEIELLAKAYDVTYNPEKEGYESKERVSVPVKKVKARDILRKVALFAHAKGDPAFLYFHNGNIVNPRKNFKGEIRVTNPCGEEMLYPYTSCNLSSIDISKFIREGEEGPYFDWDAYREAIRVNARFLDNVNDVNKYPLKKIAVETRKGRNIGAGLMGVAHALFKLGIPYNSEEAFDFISKVSEYLTYYTMDTSIELAKEKYPFPEFEQSEYPNGYLPFTAPLLVPEKMTLDWDNLKERMKNGIRNVDFTTAPPTGSTSMIADSSNGVEPLFALVYEKRTTVGTYYYVDHVFKEWVEKHIRDSATRERVYAEISKAGGLKEIQHIPGIDDELLSEMKKLFVTSREIAPEDHVVSEAHFAFFITNAVSKTINLPNKATVEDVEKAFVLAEILGLKGITVYRDGSLDSQVYVTEEVSYTVPYPMSEGARKWIEWAVQRRPEAKEFLLSSEEDKKSETRRLDVMSFGFKTEEKEEDSLICPVCGSQMIVEAGCKKCPNCGYSPCTVS